MKFRPFPLLVLMLIAASTLIACNHANASTTDHMSDDGHMDMGADGHMDGADHMDGAGEMGHIHATLPHEYEDLENPFAGDAAAVTAGSELFATNCTACHGPEGRGDGPTAETLTPAPADLTDSTMMHQLNDAYLYWRIATGGVGDPFNSAMPAWQEKLTDEEIWQLVTYVRSLSGE